MLISVIHKNIYVFYSFLKAKTRPIFLQDWFFIWFIHNILTFNYFTVVFILNTVAEYFGTV